MPAYRRAVARGATFFFTVVAHRRLPILCESPALDALRVAFADVCGRRPFHVDAAVVLPDHLHCIWTLPDGDSDFSTRWRLIKASFTLLYLRGAGTEARRGASRDRHGERGVWQRRFWEHTIRDEGDFERHVDYIHYNPVRHGLAACPHEWAPSSFERWVERGVYPRDWCCACEGRPAKIPSFVELADRVGEQL